MIRLLPTDPPPHTLALVIAVAVHRALSDYVGAQAIRIKWPNDIMAGAAKLSGMLLERAEDAIIIGIGVNVAHAPDLADRQAISLRELGAQSCDPAMLLEAIACYFEDGVRQWRSFGVEPVARNWQERAHATGTPLAAMLADGQRIEGRFASLDGDGALILRLADGRSHVIHAGDVFLI
ncbi:MAG: biotin--[acetyl-CoA-carboxylase] ligase [Sphingobium sp. 32-64-5]|nr:MAG: biotin--[acetyl-CoA-carboxylase] ligase [Sphingobium sp. 32-64-5]